MKYKTIVVDPPWIYTKWGAPSNRKEQTYSLPYPAMTIEEIKALPVLSLADQDSCELYLWTTNRYLPHAFEILTYWGFQYSQTLVWCKTPRGTGQGGIYTPTTEFILLGRVGKMPDVHRIDSTWFHWKRQHNMHSKKPGEFFDLIERVTQSPRLEMFARRRRVGWNVWGDEVESDLELEGFEVAKRTPLVSSLSLWDV